MPTGLFHSGVKRRSGRYPWGSGEEPEQRGTGLAARAKELRKKGMSEVEAAKALGMTTGELRKQKSLEKDAQRQSDASFALRLKDKGYSNTAIGERLKCNESHVRDLLKPAALERSKITNTIAEKVRSNVAEKKYLDVGIGTELHLGVTRTKLDTAIKKLQDEGYTLHYVKIPQLGTNHETWFKVLTEPNVPYKEVYANKYNIKSLAAYSTDDGGRSLLGLETPRSIDSKKIMIRYSNDGGADKDGVIELRRGVPELALGKRYAQVRIAVDGTHYLKGMAIHGDNADFPKGVDVIFNTNKSSDVPKMKVLKSMSDDDANPFGAIVRQKKYLDKDGKEQLSALNIVGYKDTSGEEGAWGEWSKTLSSQMLSKQAPEMAKKQLALAYEAKKQEYDEIISMTNPAVKKKLLEIFSDGCDSSAVHLKAAALPRQQSHVILPIPSLKDNEVYAPNYNNGEQVVLIRYPHGGIFEIPQLKVNNNHPDGKRILGSAKDAIGINPKVAQKLSGADFDGDTVLVIPNPPSIGVKVAPSQKALIDFDPKVSYPKYQGMKCMSEEMKGREMGNISNLITDMTIKGAPLPDIIKAVKHSMVVIDAAKHELDYHRSYADHNIAQLKRDYQGGATRGASTLISKASADKRVAERKERVLIDPATGKKIYTPTGNSYMKQIVTVDPVTGKKTYVPTGKPILKTVKSTKMAEEDDAYTLSSGTRMENIYAAHANKLKALGNESRKALVMTDKIAYSAEANRRYKTEVDSLKAQLNIALKNAPLERQAMVLGNAEVKRRQDANPDLKGAELKKIKGALLTEMRTRIGAKKERITISDREWEAIQAGAVTNSVLTKILNNTDLDALKVRSMPRESVAISTVKADRAKRMLKAGRTQAQVAEALGLSVGSIQSLIYE